MKNRHRMALLGLGVVALAVAAGCTSETASDSEPGQSAVSASELTDAVAELVDSERDSSDRAVLVAGGDDRDEELLAVDAVVAQADSEILVEVDALEELAPGVSEGVLTVKLASIEGIRDERIVGRWPVVACRCDAGDQVQISALSFCAIVGELGAPCEP